MSIFSDLLNFKVKKGMLSVPPFIRKAKAGSVISDDTVNRANVDLTTLRTGTTVPEIIRNYAKVSPDVSHSIENYIRFIVTQNFTIVAKDLETDTIDVESTELAQVFAARMNKLPTIPGVFNVQSSIKAISETLISQLLTNGTCAGELVLDKALLPSKISPISTNDLKYESGGDRVVPFLKESTGDIYLDSPAVCILSLTQDISKAYADSWLGSSVQAIISSAEFTNDLRRSFRRASLPRVSAKIDVEKFKASLSPEILYDPEKFKAAFNTAISSVQESLDGLEPEDALVTFDSVEISHLSAGNVSVHESVDTHARLLNGQLSTGLHVLPSLLGRGESQATSSTETVLFLKIAESLQGRLNEFFSYMFTLAVRLQGKDVTVDFKFKRPSLRPEIEEESFLAVRQSRLLELLSYGLISDEEASIELTGDLPSGNFQPLSGTRFRDGVQSEEPENPYSNTSVTGKGVSNSSDQKTRQSGDKAKSKTNKTSGN